MKKKILALFLAAVTAFTLAACASNSGDSGSSERIVSLAASNTEILIGLGLKDSIIAADIYSSDTGLDPDICTFDMQNPDIEGLVALKPDVIFTNEINTDGASDPYAELKKLGTTVISIDSADSIDEIKEDIMQIASLTKTEKKGEELTKSIDETVEKVRERTKNLPQKSVYFEISAAPYCYSLGSGTFINEIIEICGGENIFVENEGWLSVTEESVIAANPDVIISSVSYEGYDFTEISKRSGWDSINAVKEGKVYSVNSNASNRASQNITVAIEEIAEAINPTEK